MKQLNSVLEGIGSAVLLTVRAFTMLPAAPRIIKRVVEQAFIGGYSSLPIVSILSFFIGGVLALQAGISMQDIGTKELIGTLVGEALVRELGPVLVAILVAGRVGSAITAELASMKVYNEVDALVTMNIPPERFLVLPRLLAVILYMPVLTMIGIVIGWLGGAVVCKFVGFINVAPEQYFQSLRHVFDRAAHVRRAPESRNFRLLRRPDRLHHRPAHQRRPARDWQFRHTLGRHFAHHDHRARLLPHQDPRLMKKSTAACERHDRNPVPVEVAGLSKNYGSQAVLTDISLSIKPQRNFRHHGPERLGQERAAAPDCRARRRRRPAPCASPPSTPPTRIRATASPWRSSSSPARSSTRSAFTTTSRAPIRSSTASRSKKREIHDRVMRALQILSLEAAAQKASRPSCPAA